MLNVVVHHKGLASRTLRCRQTSLQFTWHAVFVLHGEQVEVWLTQEVLAKNKRVGGISARYYGARTNGPPSSVSEEKVRILSRHFSRPFYSRGVKMLRKGDGGDRANTLYSQECVVRLGRSAFPRVCGGIPPWVLCLLHIRFAPGVTSAGLSHV